MNKELCSPVLKSNNIIDTKYEHKSIHISITYLDDKCFGFKDILKTFRKNSSFTKEINHFLDRARQYDNIGDFISNHISHNRGKNDDEKSRDKVSQLVNDYDLEIDHLIHLHCYSGGKGKLVVHGFQIDNTFEIVWFDPEHELHKLK